MRLPKEVFLEQIIENIGVFECIADEMEGMQSKDKPNFILNIAIRKEKIEDLNVGYYYDLEASNEITPYVIYIYYNREDNLCELKYVNLKINIDKTRKYKKQISEDYRKTYLLSRFFSNIYFNKNPDNSWKFLIANLKKLLSSCSESNDKEIGILKKIKENPGIIKTAQHFQKFDINRLNIGFVSLNAQKGIGPFYASMILHALYPNHAMIYNKDCYKFLCDHSLLSGKGIEQEYQNYSRILCDRVNMIHHSVLQNYGKTEKKNEDLMYCIRVSNNIRDFVYSDFLREIL